MEDQRGDEIVRNLEGSRVRLSETRAVDIVEFRVHRVQRDGEGFVQVRSHVGAVLPRSRRYDQTFLTYLDEEYVLRTSLPEGRTRLLHTSGRNDPVTPRCEVPRARIDGRYITQLLPIRCIPHNPGEAYPPTTVISVMGLLRATASQRLVSNDATRSTRPLTW